MPPAFIVKLVCFFGATIVSGTLCALDLKQPDRLNTAAKHFGNIEKTAFLALQHISDRIVTVGDRGVIAYSDDNAQSWQQSDVPISTLITAMHFPNASEGWAVGHGGSILHSADRGETWQLQLDGRKVNELLLQKAKDKLQETKQEFIDADESEQPDLQYAVEDAEFALSNAEFDKGLGPANPFLDVLFLDNKKGFAIGAYGLFVMTEDGGQSWQSIAGRLENFDRYHLNTLAQLKGGAIIIAGEAGSLFASYDQGEQWETLYGPYQGSFFGIQPTNNEDEALLYGLKGHIFKTEDGGQSWKKIQADVETSLTSSAFSQDGQLIISGFSGVILISNDSGNSFSRIKTKGYEGFNAVDFVSTHKLVLVSDEGIQTLGIK